MENVFEYVFIYETERGGRGIVRADNIAEAAERVRDCSGRAVTSIKRASELDTDHGVIDVHFMWED